MLAPTARGDGGMPLQPMVGSPGIVDGGNKARYVALAAGRTTLVAKISTEDGNVERIGALRGAYGVPVVTYAQDVDGLSPDGLRLVLAGRGNGKTVLRRVSRFALFDTILLGKPELVALRGDFSFDAVSPNGKRLYLVQHPSAQNRDHYLVRAYDLVHRRLLPHPIVDRTEPNMRGIPYARLATRDGSWIYTLYLGGKESFVHALDTVHGRAVCLDLHWTKKDGALWRMKLRFLDHGRRLGFVDRASGRRARPTLDLSRRASGLGGGWIGIVFGAALAATAVLLWRRRRGASRAVA